MQRVLIIGLDGADLRHIYEGIERGELPHLGRLISRGSHGFLLSTIPSLTPVAWPSFFTGLNPAKHGIFGWTTEPMSRGSVVGSRDVKGKPLWEILSQRDEKCIVVGLPLAFPPRELRGCMVGSWTDFGDTLIWPDEWAAKVRSRFGSMLNYPPARAFSPGVLQHKWEVISGQMTEITLFLMNSIDSRLTCIVYPLIDHYNHLGLDLSRAYQVIDRDIGKLLSAVQANTTIFVISDHGSTKLHSKIYLGNWLYNKGLITLPEYMPDKLFCRRLRAFLFGKLGMTSADKACASTLRAWRALPTTAKRVLSQWVWQRYGLMEGEIDLARSKVYISSNGEIFVLAKDKYSHGSLGVDEYRQLKHWLRDELLEMRDPSTGETIFKEVLDLADIYTGPYAGRSADLYAVRRYEDSLLVTVPSKFSDLSIVEPCSGIAAGDHRREGVFICAGEGIRRGAQLSVSSITDVFPTVLYILGIPIPKNVDGCVTRGAFMDSYLTLHPESYGAPVNLDGELSSESSDERIVRERLEALGYL